MTKIAFVFPGQASQFVGMGIDFYNSSKIAREMYDYAEEVFGFPLKEYSFYGPLSKLTVTKVTQPAIFVNSLVILENLKTKNFIPSMVAGHSLGEYSSLVAAETISFEAGLKLVKIRSEQMHIVSEKKPGTMAAIVGLGYEKILETIKKGKFSGVCQIANYNSPSQIIITGEVQAVQEAMLELKNLGAKRAIELSVGGAFHSVLMEEARAKLKEAISSTKIRPPKYPFYSNVTGTPTSDTKEIKIRLYQQLVSPVLWVDTIKNMRNDGAELFIELGPGKVLQGLIKKILPEVEVAGISTFEELKNFQCK